MWGIHRGPVNSPHKWPVITSKMFPFDDVIMRWWLHLLTAVLLTEISQADSVWRTSRQSSSCLQPLSGAVITTWSPVSTSHEKSRLRSRAISEKKNITKGNCYIAYIWQSVSNRTTDATHQISERYEVWGFKLFKASWFRQILQKCLNGSGKYWNAPLVSSLSAPVQT